MLLQVKAGEVTLLVVIIALVFFVIRVLKNKKSFYNPLAGWLNNNTGGIKKDNELIEYYHRVLTHYVDFYRKLDRVGRRKFIDRLHDFIEQMEFTGRDDQPINLKVCVLCAAPMIQISFGLTNYLFNNFHTIVVYPRQFYSDTQVAYVKGGVSRGDAIFFSFEDLVKGFENPNDAINLGLHEMAHAIHIEYFDDEFERKFPNWERVAIEEVAKIRHEKDPVLRNYSGKNKHELFAVCVETFFEQPNELKKQSPALFESMCNLLNQRPY